MGAAQARSIHITREDLGRLQRVIAALDVRRGGLPFATSPTEG